METSQLTIDSLDDDCMLHIFSFLSMYDRVCANRVNTRWNNLITESWKDVKAVSLRRSYWGLNSEFRRIKFKNFMNFLYAHGSRVVHIDLYNMREDGLPDPDVIVRTSRATIRDINEWDLSRGLRIKSIDTGVPILVPPIEFIADSFKDLTRFATHRCTDIHDEALKTIFSNNNLKYISLKECQLLTDCLKDGVHSEFLEEFHFIDCEVIHPQNFVEALENFKNLHTLSIIRPKIKNIEYIPVTMRAIGEIAKNVRSLSLRFYENWVEQIDYSFIDGFRNLEKLFVEGVLVSDSFLACVSLNCTKLTSVTLQYSGVVTDDGISSIIRLPKLQYLRLDSLELVTDEALRVIPKLISLHVSTCPNVQDAGIIRLLQSTTTLTDLRFTCCQVSATVLISTLLERKYTYVSLSVDNANNPTSPYVEDLESLHAFDTYANWLVKKLCYTCSNSPVENCCDCTDSNVTITF